MSMLSDPGFDPKLERSNRPVILTVPGLDGSGPGHWQTIWEQVRTDTHRVELGQWTLPHRNSWITKLDQAVRRSRAPVVLVAHSLGCIAVAWWATFSSQPYGWPVAGALLVAPADADCADNCERIKPFAPVPRQPLPFPSLVVASEDDPWITPHRAHDLAQSWGSDFVEVGAMGHINADSGLGAWQEGQALLERLIDPAASHGRAASVQPMRAERAVMPLEARPFRG